MPAAANRLIGLVDQYPLYSKAGDSLYEAGDSYIHMGPHFRKQAGEEFSKVVRDYPTSLRAKEAANRLEELEMPVPKPDQAAIDRGKFEQGSYKKPGMMAKSMGLMKSNPDVSHAAHAGAPTMTDPKRLIPASVPVPATTLADTTSAAPGGETGTTDVSATPVSGSSALDTKPDARAADETAAAKPEAAPQPAAPLPTNRDADLKKMRERQAKQQAKLNMKKKSKDQPADSAAPASATTQSQTPQSQATQGAQTAGGVPNAVSNPPASTPPPNE